MIARTGLIAALLVWSLILASGSVVAQPPPLCRVSNISPANRTLSVNCAISTAESSRLVLSFLDRFAGLERVSERIVNIRVKDASGGTVPLELRGNGVYAFNTPKSSDLLELGYEVKLARALEPGQYALTSSLGPEAGFLFATDLFPQGLYSSGRLRVAIDAPEGWQIATTSAENGKAYELSDTRGAIFFLGRLRLTSFEVGRMHFRLAIAGTWEFSDRISTETCESIARAQAARVDSGEEGDYLVTLAPFPLPLTGLRSAALARDHTVVLMLNPGNDGAKTLRHYQRHLAHEMFHFYLPNAFRIKENFDWFWEGFTRYLALVTLVETRRITFEDLLAAVADEYEVYSVNPLRSRTSLLSASPEKFSDVANYEIVYRKGLVVAALFDLELRWQTRGKSQLADSIRSLYQVYARTGRDVGNKEVLDELSRAGSFSGFIADYIEGVREIDLAAALEPYGIVIDRGGVQSRPRLVVSQRLSERQRAALKALLAP